MILAAAFYLISALLLFSALMVVTQRNLFNSALYLAAALSLVAGLFVFLSADFLAAVQILLYVGGILVILVFAVMLSSIEQSRLAPQTNEQWLPSLLFSLLLLFVILIALKRADFPVLEIHYAPTTRAMGELLLKEMKLPFEAVSLVLLVSLVGAVLFSRRQEEPK